MSRRKQSAVQIPSAKSDDQLVNRKMLNLVRHEFKREFQALEHKMDARFNETKAEIHELRSEIHGLKAEIHGLKAEIDNLRSTIENMNATLAHLTVMFEEQRANNNFVLEGHQGLWQRQERLEGEFGQIRSEWQAIRRPNS
jgi:chromosome segregation ATPase